MNTTTAADRRLLNVQELDARPTFNSFRGTYVGRLSLTIPLAGDHRAGG